MKLGVAMIVMRGLAVLGVWLSGAALVAADSPARSDVNISVMPTGDWVTVTPLAPSPPAAPDQRVQAPTTISLPPGRYRFTSDAGGFDETTVVAGRTAQVLIEQPRRRAGVRDRGAVDFVEEGVAEPVAGAPPNVRHPSLLPDRYQRALARINAPGYADRERAGGSGRGRTRGGLGVSAAVGGVWAFEAVVRIDARLGERLHVRPRAGWRRLSGDAATGDYVWLGADLAWRPAPAVLVGAGLASGLRVHGDPSTRSHVTGRGVVSVHVRPQLELALEAEFGLSAWRDGARQHALGLGVATWF